MKLSKIYSNTHKESKMREYDDLEQDSDFDGNFYDDEEDDFRHSGYDDDDYANPDDEYSDEDE
ncbi:hypothetical protein LS74_006215 [Helicobacter magdeburgensis]|uniref:Uncharacterized protein n=1 Tax=Helicobacter magdeburgensis TaxID=471858 RepID=A0A4V6I1F9_9HELI|nr:hypothetical protein LS74_006215 [Helicobacter magdeburgensis]